MAATNGYITLAALRGELDITDATDLLDNTRLDVAIQAASRAIDDECGRRFYVDTTATLRYFRAYDDDYMVVDDISSAKGLIVATDADNDRVWEQVWQRRITWSRSTPWRKAGHTRTCASHPMARTTSRELLGRQVTALCGWPTIPLAIQKATTIQALKLYKRRDAPFGVMGIGDTGQFTMPAIDPDVDGRSHPRGRGVPVRYELGRRHHQCAIRGRSERCELLLELSRGPLGVFF